ncbi:MAG: TonB-dependent receptor [Nevskiaceae bacterium]|nr:TonB-dependent receptor [Nevskiaceae bacterium]
MAAQSAAPPSSDALLDPVVVVAPLGGSGEPDRIPVDMQSASAGDFEALQAMDLSDFMNRSFGSVSINHAQNNPLQPDFNFRGFTASPLLGLPQGLAVYQNGMRVNESFGDAVNWDLIALSAVQEIQLLSGANPVFGLNTLGGALSVRMKDGFTFARNEAQVYAGSFGRMEGTAQFGGNDGRWGYYTNIDYFREDGWRDFSPSDALRWYGAVGWRGEDSTFDLSAAHVNSDMSGNGAAPVQLLREDWSAVFTHPDRTRNELTQVIAEASTQWAGWRVSGNVYLRQLNSDSFNGDGTVFEPCIEGGVEFLCEEDDDQPLRDQSGNAIPAELGDQSLDAINNISTRRQRSWGAAVQASAESQLSGGRRNSFTVGAAHAHTAASFAADVEVASLQPDRSTNRTGIFADELRTELGNGNRNWSLYFIDTLDLSDALTLTLSGRYDHTRISLRDHSLSSPELNGVHDWSAFKPAAGLSWRVSAQVRAYANWSQSARAPTAVELACADENAPCNLPNSFLADPPLQQVVANGFELGADGSASVGDRAARLNWHAGAFVTVNRNDILFQTTGGPQANVGFFQNVGDTRRAGIELRIEQSVGRVDWHVDYSAIAATFADQFIVNSANHPLIPDNEKLPVAKGSTIPAIPRHQFNAGVDIRFTDALTIGADIAYRSGVYLRGDESNLLEPTGGFGVVNLRAEFAVSQAVRVFARIENLFDRRYETFGVLGEPDEVFEEFDDPRFLGPAPPLGAWAGVRVRF